MFSVVGLTNYLAIKAFCRNIKDTASGTILSLRRSTRLTGQKESSVTKEEFGALVKSLNRLGLGMSGGDAGQGLQPTRSSALLMSVFSTHPCWIPH